MPMLSFANDCNRRTDDLEKLLQDDSMPKHVKEKMKKRIKDMRKQSKLLIRLNEVVDSYLR